MDPPGAYMKAIEHITLPLMTCPFLGLLCPGSLPRVDGSPRIHSCTALWFPGPGRPMTGVRNSFGPVLSLVLSPMTISDTRHAMNYTCSEVVREGPSFNRLKHCLYL